MAHTPRKRDEKRRHPLMYPVGTDIGMYAADGTKMKGRVTLHDEGGWIYTSWPGWQSAVHGPLPSHMRSTNVFKWDE